MPSKLEILTASTDLKGIVISPEGAEEKLTEETIFRITLTQGGKYRVYMTKDDEKGKPDTSSMGLFDTLKAAQDHEAHGMAITGSLVMDRKGTIDALLGSLRPKK